MKHQRLNEIDPCPKCHAEPKLTFFSDATGERWEAKCGAGCGFPGRHVGVTRERAIANWNRGIQTVRDPIVMQTERCPKCSLLLQPDGACVDCPKAAGALQRYIRSGQDSCGVGLRGQYMGA